MELDFYWKEFSTTESLKILPIAWVRGDRREGITALIDVAVIVVIVIVKVMTIIIISNNIK